jgi:hypothetical protein
MGAVMGHTLTEVSVSLTDAQASFLEIEVMGRGFLVDPADTDSEEQELLRGAEAVERGLHRSGKKWELTVQREDLKDVASALLQGINAADDERERRVETAVKQKTLDAMSAVHLELLKAARE